MTRNPPEVARLVEKGLEPASPAYAPWYRPNRYDAAREFVKHHTAEQVREPDAVACFCAGALWEAERQKRLGGHKQGRAA